MARQYEPKRVLTDLGRRVAELRDSRGLTQERFAERASWTPRYQQYIEAGRANLTVESMVRLANLLGVSPGDLLATPVSREVSRGRPKRS